MPSADDRDRVAPACPVRWHVHDVHCDAAIRLFVRQAAAPAQRRLASARTPSCGSPRQLETLSRCWRWRSAEQMARFLSWAPAMGATSSRRRSEG
eukprot:7379480-Prymnesium_polylepis.1